MPNRWPAALAGELRRLADAQEDTRELVRKALLDIKRATGLVEAPKAPAPRSRTKSTLRLPHRQAGSVPAVTPRTRVLPWWLR